MWNWFHLVDGGQMMGHFDLSTWPNYNGWWQRSCPTLIFKDCRLYIVVWNFFKKNLPCNCKNEGASYSVFRWNEEYHCIIVERKLFDSWVKVLIWQYNFMYFYNPNHQQLCLNYVCIESSCSQRPFTQIISIL